MMQRGLIATGMLAALVAGASVWAQPAPTDPYGGAQGRGGSAGAAGGAAGSGEVGAGAGGGEAAAGSGAVGAGVGGGEAAAGSGAAAAGSGATGADAGSEAAASALPMDRDDAAHGAAARPARPPDPPVAMPELITIPTGWLLPAAVLYSRTGLDTGGGISSDERVGLGDVAEFGVATLDDIRAQRVGAAAPDHVQPYVAASFRMGLQEDRLFGGQPGLVLGFRKSFESTHDAFKTQIAELTLVASKHLGHRFALHVGGAFWDASLEGPSMPAPVTLHGEGLSHQLEVFGGLEARPFARSEILVDLGWAPVFDEGWDPATGSATPPSIALKPELAWGVRYHVNGWLYLESGVRVPDIGDAKLLDAQIFGRLTITSFALRHAVDGLR